VTFAPFRAISVLALPLALIDTLLPESLAPSSASELAASTTPALFPAHSLVLDGRCCRSEPLPTLRAPMLRHAPQRPPNQSAATLAQEVGHDPAALGARLKRGAGSRSRRGVGHNKGAAEVIEQRERLLQLEGIAFQRLELFALGAEHTKQLLNLSLLRQSDATELLDVLFVAQIHVAL